MMVGKVPAQDAFREIAQAINRARSWMGEEGEQVSQALTLLEEARSWLPLELAKKLPKMRAPQYPWPEVLLFWALAKLRTLKVMFSAKIRARKSYGELPRVTDLLEKAGAYLQEAWLAYLHRHGLPSGFKPVRSFYRSAGLTVMFFTTIGFSFLNRLLSRGQNASLPIDPNYTILVWAFLVSLALGKFSYPKRPKRGPLFLPRSTPIKRLLPLTLGLVGLPALGMLFWPEWTNLFLIHSALALSLACPFLAQAVRLLLFPADARILVLPRINVIFVPRIVSFSPEKVFVTLI